MKNPIKELGRALEWHKERHRPSGFSFSIADSIDFLEDKSWDLLTAQQSFFLRRPYLRALESTVPGNMRLRYALVFDGKRPVAATVMQVVDIAPDMMSKSGAAGKLAAVHAKALVCGNLFSWGQHGVAFADDADPTTVWPGVAEALYRVRQAERLSGKTDLVMVKDHYDDSEGVEVLERFSYGSMDTDPNMMLTIDPSWKNFEDYLTGLHSKYRKNAKKIMRDLAAAGCVIEPLGDWKKNSARIHELYLEVHDAAAVKPVTAMPGYMAAVAEAAGSDMRCNVIRRGSEILGFVTTIKEDDETAIGYYIGFDRALKRELPLYFALLQAVVADAISFGCRRLSFGRTALAPKANLGALPKPMKIWVRAANPMANILVKKLLHMVHHDEPPERNPFKEAV